MEEVDIREIKFRGAGLNSGLTNVGHKDRSSLPFISGKGYFTGILPLKNIFFITVSNVPNIILIGIYQNLKLIVIIVVEGVGIIIFTEVASYADINGVKAGLIGISFTSGNYLHPKSAVLGCMLVSAEIENIFGISFTGAKNLCIHIGELVDSLLNGIKLFDVVGILISDDFNLISIQSTDNVINSIYGLKVIGGNIVLFRESSDSFNKVFNDISVAKFGICFFYQIEKLLSIGNSTLLFLGKLIISCLSGTNSSNIFRSKIVNLGQRIDGLDQGVNSVRCTVNIGPVRSFFVFNDGNTFIGGAERTDQSFSVINFHSICNNRRIV